MIKNIIRADNWAALLTKESSKDYYQNIITQLSLNDNFLPARSKIFRCFELCPLEKVAVVILGQDPYHTVGLADGLAFSVPKNAKLPPSLVNILQELVADINCSPFPHGNLDAWAHQGVLLLNTCLTVLPGKPMSHRHLGWHNLIIEVFEQLNRSPQVIIFMLWGAEARKYQPLINHKHLVLQTSHPSPLSYHRGFKGCQHFSICNKILTKLNYKTIKWQWHEH